VGSSDINSLSNRELEIFSFIGRGVSVSELASELNVSVKTIETRSVVSFFWKSRGHRPRLQNSKGALFHDSPHLDTRGGCDARI